jgi:hyperosmotically inducible periplasmic protein
VYIKPLHIQPAKELIMTMKYLKSRLLITALVVGLAGCASTRTHESTGEYFDDTTLTTKVKTAIATSEDVSAARINVETYKGEVQLSGFAKSREEADRAISIASHVKGVKSVRDDIAIRSDPQAKESAGEYFDDTTLTAKVKAALLADKQVSAARINVETFKGIVQLSGFANNKLEADKAVEIAINVRGVKSVKDDIRIK